MFTCAGKLPTILNSRKIYILEERIGADEHPYIPHST